ncbi:class C sortase [Vagococcus fluvialis]|nr:class C sortase [Vagococcus fluvialis]
MVLQSSMMILFVLGAIIFSYPFIADSINNYYDQKNLEKFQDANNKESDNIRKERLKELEEENKKEKLEKGILKDPFKEINLEEKNIDKNYLKKHQIGAIYIPTINVSLPLFDETNSELLEVGATVLQGTSYPIGGMNTHSAITGHSGLSNKKLFTDVEKLKKKNEFIVDVYGQKNAYEIFDIKVVKPDAIDKLDIQKGKELVTLVTCTPYAVNTHRLLVTGKRVPIKKNEISQQIKKAENYHKRKFYSFFVGIPIILSLIIYWFWWKIRFYKSTKKLYELSFYIMENKKPIKGVVFQLVHKNNKYSEKNRQVKSNKKGLVKFKKVFGGKYDIVVVNEENIPKIKARSYRLSDKNFVIVSPKSLLSVRKKRNRIYTIDLKSKEKKWLRRM